MKKAVIYGAGNIGRGFIGQIFSQSGYEIVFLDINTVIVDRLNSDHCYPIQILGDGVVNEIFVENARGVNAADIDLTTYEIATADIMASSVGVNVLPRIVGNIAGGLIKRWESGNFKPLNIIICENLLDANHYLENLIKQVLGIKEIMYFDETVGLVEASIGRMVPVMTPEMQKDNPLKVCVEEYCELPVDKDAFKGEIPDIINMEPFSPFDFYIQRKLFMHNMAHALMAYLGFSEDIKYIWEANNNPYIKLITLRALMESSVAMSEEHGVPLKILFEHSEDLLYRFGNRLLGDTVERVGKDPIRKLSKNDRMIGAGLLCQKHGIKPVYISLGIAAGFLFDPKEDLFASKVRGEVLTNGIETAIMEICGIEASNSMIKMITEFYALLNCRLGLDEILLKAEQMKK